jgi:hypothetical protein
MFIVTFPPKQRVVAAQGKKKSAFAVLAKGASLATANLV